MRQRTGIISRKNIHEFKLVCDAGYKPIRVMFYYPNRSQAKKIQKTLETLYHGVNGEYHYGDNAWDYVKRRSDIDLLAILEKLAKENAPE